MSTLREAAQKAHNAWEAWQDTAAMNPPNELFDAMAELGEALMLTGDDWQILPSSSPNLTAAEYAAHYFGVEQ